MAQRRQITELERKLTESKTPTPKWLTPKEVALLLGRSVDFVRDHADELGGLRIGNGPRPRPLFPADPVSSGEFPLDSAERHPAPHQDGEPPTSPGR
jgi:hypothetical protein